MIWTEIVRHEPRSATQAAVSVIVGPLSAIMVVIHRSANYDEFFSVSLCVCV